MICTQQATREDANTLLALITFKHVNRTHNNEKTMRVSSSHSLTVCNVHRSPSKSLCQQKKLRNRKKNTFGFPICVGCVDGGVCFCDVCAALALHIFSCCEGFTVPEDQPGLTVSGPLGQVPQVPQGCCYAPQPTCAHFCSRYLGKLLLNY